MVFDLEGYLRVAGGKCNTRYVEMFSAHQLIVSKNAFSLVFDLEGYLRVSGGLDFITTSVIPEMLE